MSRPTSRAEGRAAEPVHELLAGEDGTRLCEGISADACRWVPRNSAFLVATKTLTKIGDELASAKTVLAWVVNFVGAPALLLGLLVPVRESGSMIPQLVIAAWVRRMPVRKWVWVTGSVSQCVAVAVIGLAALLLEGMAAGVVLLAALVVFSLARGLCSLSHKDVLGKTIPKRRRGTVSGLAVGVSGVFVVLVGLVIFWLDPGEAGAVFYGSLLLGAGALWLLAAAIFARIREFPGEVSEDDTVRDGVRRLGWLSRDRQFRRFVVTRALLVSSALVAPYYVALAQRSAGGSSSMLGTLIVAGGLASSLSAPLWGRMADRSSRRVLLLAACIAGMLGVVVFAVERFVAEVPFWTWPGAFLLLGVAHTGIRLGRKTYVVDMAGGNRRTDYVAVSNSVMGVVLLAAGLVTASLSFLPLEFLVLGLSVTALAGALCGAGLPEVES